MTTATPVIFIHGLFLHATSWGPWVELFREAGYEPTAPGWPGVPDSVSAAREHPEEIADHGIDDVVEHYAKLIAELGGAKPILVGHSFGGMIAQKLLGQDLAAAAVAIDAAQIKGVLPLPLSTLRVGLPVLRNPANKHKSVSLTADQFRYAFGNAVSESESLELFERWAIPAPGKPLFEAAAANFDPHSPAKVDTANELRGPLLLIMGGRDHTVPESITRSTLKQYRHSHAVTDIQEFADRAHSLTIDSGWREVADATLAWLRQQGL
ncbi:pimeloyl-ACP methyl ester carboxylesterase [Allocatelliglobosispora scoriae]|uniref:Pimeloyl-ACP methyl ester carboxylesterase n=1 Tax=Allocatelliglobosispora scoriae TaxID=643052 RepID=A0A841BL29_9ACTN|nr:alpha/beta fold hydrolase [Allocatelliglobosispora scoriae]MBB5867571.1 pimeloyl-ACP methyl ester carboxylesterase [Allocatelliglobosispora scoriae]